LRIAGDSEEVSLRELGSSVVLHSLLTSSPALFQSWENFDDLVQKFVGVTDSMNVVQLDNVMKHAKASISTIKKEKDLVDLQKLVVSMDLGTQTISGHPFFSPLSSEQTILPRAFTLMGQKFTLDSWVTSNVTFDRIVNDRGHKVQRRIPSVLDVVYTVFNNEHVGAELSRRMKDKNGKPFRDGYPYHARLLALRKVLENVPEKLWSSSIYFQWLATLRKLSTPLDEISASISSADAGRLPQTACSAAWQDRVLNTQCASWTQLRHDSILYVKQSYSGMLLCEYPAGYVEPNPAFWSQFLEMAKYTLRLLQNLKTPKDLKEDKNNSWKWTHQSMIHVFQNFEQVLKKLVSISEKQAANKPLITPQTYESIRSGVENISEDTFLKSVMEESHGSGSSRYDGWYPSLFFPSRNFSGKWDPVIADVHTDLPDEMAGDPGCVLHEGVGNVHTMLVAFKREDSVICYAGPVMSHYEFTCEINERKNDAEWREMLRTQPPPHPEWTRSFLAPCTNPAASGYKHETEGGRSYP